MPGEIKMIQISELRSPGSARRSAHRSSQEALHASVKRSGVQVPVLVSEVPGGWLILKGHRRVQAAKAAGLSEVPCLTMDPLSEDDAYEQLADWNALGGALRPVDLVDLVLARCAQRLGEDPAAVSAAWKKVAKDPQADTDQYRTVRAAVRDYGAGEVDAFLALAVKLLRLPEGLLTPLRLGALNEDQALALAGVKDLELRTVWQTRAEAGEMTALEIKRAAKQAKEQNKAGDDADGESGGAGGGEGEDSDVFEELEAAIEERIRDLPEKLRPEARKYLRSLRGLFRSRT